MKNSIATRHVDLPLQFEIYSMQVINQIFGDS